MRKFFISVMLLAMLVSIGFISFKHFLEQQWNQEKSSQVALLAVEPGDNFYKMVNLAFTDAEQDNWWLRFWIKLNPQFGKIKVGHYQLAKHLSYATLSQLLTSGNVVQLKVSLIEGETFKQFWQKLNQAEGIKSSSKTEQELASWLGSERSKLEGLLLPETYFYVHGTSAEEIVKRAYLALDKTLLAHWQLRDKHLPLAKPYDALILASIIEKETGAKFERPRIASVFINRLNKGMRLQTDPTVIYGMGDRYDGNIRRKDLREATEYNTYVIKALPPTPIAMASEDAIAAALNPEHTQYLYFVAKGRGEHYFSKSLAEHNRAVRKYILKK
ncbi:endolytic transglycosylase MltG [Agarivorans sp. QJM3NY_33]|uniref:endolytic transglycosylase MltG n=1 Tax=Agarivorans sp. QJM3NY_33 TaxID=3421432 RepID=UPI003D7DFB9C